MNAVTTRKKTAGELATEIFANGGRFENEYTLWVEERDGLVAKAWEYTDIAHSTAQMEKAANQA